MNDSELLFQSSHYLSFLRAAANSWRSTAGKPLSLRQLSKKLGFRSPRSVGMVLSGTRLPSVEMVRAWSKSLNLTHRQARFLDTLVALEGARKKGKPVQAILKELDALRPESIDVRVLNLEAFSFIAEWYHLVIKQMVPSKPARMDYDWIRRRLNKKVSLPEIKKALRNMSRLGLIAEVAPDTFQLQQSNVSTLNDIPSEAIKLHHTQMMSRAQEALQEQTPESREFTAATFRFNPAKILDAKRMIREFREEFEKRFGSEIGAEVFQLNIQFFAHTVFKDPRENQK